MLVPFYQKEDRSVGSIETVAPFVSSVGHHHGQANPEVKSGRERGIKMRGRGEWGQCLLKGSGDD